MLVSLRPVVTDPSYRNRGLACFPYLVITVSNEAYTKDTWGPPQKPFEKQKKCFYGDSNAWPNHFWILGIMLTSIYISNYKYVIVILATKDDYYL